ncbi:MAG TPA: hypothetical protein VMR25_25965 [Planctomycetaceae bacterium]|jgi:hypothetical protein|nr:hypothetical protein [Planctomycetaceae bacterium]
MSNATGPDIHTRILLVPHPKVVFLYPTFLTAILAGCYSYFTKDPAGTGEHVISLIFLAILGFNLVVIAFDFPRTTSLTILFAVLALGIGLWFFFTEFPEWWPRIHQMLASLKPAANPTFYFMFAGILALLYLGVLINTRFDYWEVRQNELLHHHGIWSNQERFAAPNLRIDKEINDLFEYLLLGSGRLVLHPSEERRAIVLDNVFFVNRKEAQLTKLLGALQVEVKTNTN